MKIKVWGVPHDSRDYLNLSHEVGMSTRNYLFRHALECASATSTANSTVAGQSTIPAVLHTCHRSRQEALRYHAMYFELWSFSYVNIEADVFVFEKPVPDEIPFEYEYESSLRPLALNMYNMNSRLLADARNIAILCEFGTFWWRTHFSAWVNGRDALISRK